MKNLICLSLLMSFSAVADSSLLEQVSQQFPEAISESEGPSASDIGNSTKRRPTSVPNLSIDLEVLLEKIIQKCIKNYNSFYFPIYIQWTFCTQCGHFRVTYFSVFPI